MYYDYAPIILLIFLAIALIALPLVIQRLISPTDNKGGEKLIPYECGEIPEGSAWVKFNIRFYVIALIALLYLIYNLRRLFTIQAGKNEPNNINFNLSPKKVKVLSLKYEKMIN